MGRVDRNRVLLGYLMCGAMRSPGSRSSTRYFGREQAGLNWTPPNKALHRMPTTLRAVVTR